MSKYSYNENYFEKIDNEVKAYWLGFLYADGCITRFYRNEKLKSMSLELTLKSNDEGHLQKFLNAIEANIPIKHKTIKNKYSASKVVVNCTKMCRDLILLGCTPQKSLNLTFPCESILPKNLYNHFICGYFDGDGGIHYGESIIYSKQRDNNYIQYSYSCYFCGTSDFLKSISYILNTNNINTSKLYQDKRSNSNNIYIYGKDNITNFKNYIYKNSTVNLSRKFDKFFYVQNNKDLKINRAV